MPKKNNLGVSVSSTSSPAYTASTCRNTNEINSTDSTNFINTSSRLRDPPEYSFESPKRGRGRGRGRSLNFVEYRACRTCGVVGHIARDCPTSSSHTTNNNGDSAQQYFGMINKISHFVDTVESSSYVVDPTFTLFIPILFDAYHHLLLDILFKVTPASFQSNATGFNSFNAVMRLPPDSREKNTKYRDAEEMKRTSRVIRETRFDPGSQPNTSSPRFGTLFPISPLSFVDRCPKAS